MLKEPLVPKDPLPSETTPLVADHQQVETNTKSSVFGEREREITWAWLIFTALYWVILIWIQTIRNMSFASGGFIIWCIGFIALFSCAYTCYEGKYPSGSTSDNVFSTNGIGRYTAAFLTTTVVIDVCILMWIIIIDDDYDSTLDSTRLSFHCIHIFWSSLFFYNTFYEHHSAMATRAFFIEWADIIWTVIVAARLRYFALEANKELNGIHYTYFTFITVTLCGWMLPMMLIRNWGALKYARIVSLHLLILDLACDIPVIIVVFSYETYKENTMLFIDVFWKTFIIVRSISYYIVNLYFFKTSAKSAEANETVNRLDGDNARKTASLLWIIYVAVYWTAFTLIETISANEIALKYQYYTWFGGMIGVMCVYDTWIAGYHATTTRGRRMLAFACTFICTDWILLSIEILRNGATWSLVTAMVLHAIAILWALVFFYRNALKTRATDGLLNEAWLSLVFEWLDIVFMYIAIVVLHGELGSCLENGICVGYVVIASIKLYLWFLPIMYRSADTEWRLHVHMVVLDTLTDLPLIIVIIASEAYTIHPFIMFDFIYKLLMLLRTYAYHLVINLILKRVELDEKHKQQLQEADKDAGVIPDEAL